MSESLRTTEKRFIRSPGGQEMTVQATYGWTWPDDNDSPYFTLTGVIWYPGDTEDDPSVGGHITDEILQAFPHLALMAQLHLADAITGEPLYAVENGWFWFDAKVPGSRGREISFPTGWASMTPAQRAAAYLHCDSSIFEGVTTKEGFAAAWKALTDTGAYEQLADAAIALYGLKKPVRKHSTDETEDAEGDMLAEHTRTLIGTGVLETLIDGAESWARELDEYVISAENDAETRAAYETTRDAINDAATTARTLV